MVLFNLQSACDRFYSVLRPVIKGLTSFPERPLSRVPDYNTTPILICQHLFSYFFALFSTFFENIEKPPAVAEFGHRRRFYTVFPANSDHDFAVSDHSFVILRQDSVPK